MLAKHTDSTTVDALRGFTDALQHSHSALQNEELRLATAQHALQEVMARVDVLRGAGAGGAGSTTSTAVLMHQRLDALRAERVKLQYNSQSTREAIQHAEAYLQGVRAPRVAAETESQEMVRSIRAMQRQYVVRSAQVQGATLAPSFLPDQCTIAQRHAAVEQRRAERSAICDVLQDLKQRHASALATVNVLRGGSLNEEEEEEEEGATNANTPSHTARDNKEDGLPPSTNEENDEDGQQQHQAAANLPAERDAAVKQLADCRQSRDALRVNMRALCAQVEAVDSQLQSEQQSLKECINSVGCGAMTCSACGADILSGFI